jgi:hypothetical protein
MDRWSLSRVWVSYTTVEEAVEVEGKRFHLGTYPGDNNLIGAVAVIQARPVEQLQVACQEARFGCLHTLRRKASSRSLRSSLYKCKILKLRSDTDSEYMSDDKDKHLAYVHRLTAQLSSATTYPNTTNPHVCMFR